MDIDTGPLHASFLGTSPAIVGHKVNNTPFSAGGLTRYHSAPSSVLAGLLDDNFFPASDDSDFARLLNDGIGSFSTLLETKHSPVFTAIPKEEGTYAPSHFTAAPKEEDTYAHTSSAKDNHSNYGAFHEPLLQSPLASISEHGGEDTAGTYLLHQLPLSSPCAISQASQHPFHARTDSSPSHSTEFTSLPKFSPGLIRQSSSPADNISRLVIDDTIEDAKLGSGLAGPCQTGKEEKGGSQMFLSSTQVSASIGTFSDVQRVNTLQQEASPKKSSSLLRHSSSPACLLSQINLEDFTNPGASSSEYYLDRRGLMSFKGSAEGRWEAMQHLPALSQRKRGRVIEDKTSIGMQGSPELANASSTSPTTAPNTMAETMESLEGYPEDIVLCKARAKRGCATHPRSIAERQRRMKISERMKKLQDLVPNLDKQASTAEMLDEVVEYVKLLQRQVEELSLNHPVCTGACQQNSDSPH